MTEKIALSMIVKGDGEEPKNLRRALKSVAPFVDGIFITLTGEKDKLTEVETVCKEFNVHVSYHRPLWVADEKAVNWLKDFFKWEPFMKIGSTCFLFDEARNYNFTQIDQKVYQWILWMDCDDILRRGENLKKLLEIGRQANVEAFYFNYLYQVELNEKGEIKGVLIQHLRERLIRNIGVYKWIAPIHETLIEQRPTRKTDVSDCDIVHLASIPDRINSLTRNLTNLELAIYKSEGKDPRHIYYLAKALYDLSSKENDDKAIPLIMTYLIGENRSGWAEERAQAWDYLADIYRRRNEYNNGIKACMNALIESPEARSPWINIAALYVQKKEHERALFWIRMASLITEKKTTLVVNPKDSQARILEVIYNSSLQLGKVDEAWAAVNKLTELMPQDPQMVNAYRFMQDLKNKRDLTVKIMELAEFLKQTGERHKIKPLLQSLPQIIENNPFMINLYQQNYPPHPWGDDEIVIYCGAGFTTWSPKKLVNPQNSFVGGSEEAVILMSKELVKLGWKVTVYADPSEDEGEYDGVTWLPYYKFNRLDNFNILIAWRDIRFFDTDFKAKKKYLWCHDIINNLEVTKERLDKITKIIVLSKWHRGNIDNVPDEKIFLSSNGI